MRIEKNVLFTALNIKLLYNWLYLHF